MNIVLLSGGSGKRLWPLSNETRSKQFLDVFKTDDGEFESMLQRMYRYIIATDPTALVTVATSQDQVPYINEQIGDVNISLEPCRRDTFPAIALAAAYLCDVECLSRDEAIIVCPVDPYVDEGYFESFKILECQILQGQANLVLMGIQPSYSSEKFGYIIPQDDKQVSSVKCFKEKPNKELAEEYISKGALWNGGVFAFKLGYVLDIANRDLGGCSYRYLFENYDTLPKISFDYAVVEKEPKIQVVRFNGIWNDLGTWDTISNILPEETSGYAKAISCNNTHIINELTIPMTVIGTNNTVVIASLDGILVADKSHTDKLKEYVSELPSRTEKKVWGDIKVVDERISSKGKRIQTRFIEINNDMRTAFSPDDNSLLIINIISGQGYFYSDNEDRSIQVGDTITVYTKQKIYVQGVSNLEIMVLEIGSLERKL